MPNFMERLQILLIGFAKATAPSFKHLPGRLSIPRALEVSMLLIDSEQHLQLLVSVEI